MFKQFGISVMVLFFIITTEKVCAQRQTSVEGGNFMHSPRKNSPLAPPPPKNAKNRSYDGTMNNIQPGKSEWGSTDIKLAREIPAEYGVTDRLNALNGDNRPSAREISNMLCDEPETVFNSRNLSAFVYVWGQFLDHDINLTPTGVTESIPIKLPDSETIFTVSIPFKRSEVYTGTGTNNIKREQINLVTAWIDGSNVYGSDETRANWLRSKKDGKMKVSSGNLLPYNTLTGEIESTIDPSAPSMVNDNNKTVKTFAAGDVRAAEHPALTSLHILFVREHNKICDRLKSGGVRGDEELYQLARKEVGGLIQAVTYNEFLPAIGISLGKYQGYNPNVNPNIMNTFATAGYRLGHTMVADDILMIDNECKEFGPGEFDLLDVFWNPLLIKDYGINYFLKGLAVHNQYETDLKVNSVLRNFLFGDPTAAIRFGLDLASINIQRGRDHGLPNYNAVRKFYTGRGANSFSEITSDTEKANTLRSLYGNVNNIDLWVGMLAEDNLPGKSVGKTVHEILKVQFEKLRDGDFYYYQNDPSLAVNTRNNIQMTKLKDILVRNTGFNSFQNNVFFAEPCPEEIVQNINNRSKNQDINNATIYPNPAGNIITFNAGRLLSEGVISIHSMDGRKIKTFNINAEQQLFDLNIADLHEGLYILSVIEESSITSLKFRKM